MRLELRFLLVNEDLSMTEVAENLAEVQGRVKAAAEGRAPCG